MYLHPPSALGPMAGNTIAACDGTADLWQELWRQVRVAFPDLPGSNFRLEQGGGDHLLLIVDETRVCRFPRPGTHNLDLEIKVLDQLRHQSLVAVPAYDMFDPDGCFASYLLIAGSPLTPSRYSRLPGKVAKTAVADAALLLKSLHALDPGTIETAGAWPCMSSPAQFVDRIESSRLSLLASLTPALVRPIARFLERYSHDQAPCEVVLHGDLVSDHLLVDGYTGHLTGIIDFSDVALGDPAQDFLGFWEYGASAAGHAVACYGASCLDPTLLVRSYNHFVRYRIDRLYEMIIDGAPARMLDRYVTALQSVLSTPPQD